MLPSIATDDVHPNPSSPQANHERNYQLHPLPLEDDRVLYWELKRPEIDQLPPIPCFDSDSEKEMSAAKAFCVENLTFTVGPCDAKSSLSCWLSNQDPLKVIETYNKLREDLPTANQWVVEHNELMVNVTGANVCTTPLGSAVQAKSALFYIVKYIGKPKVPLGQCLTTLNASMEHVKEYPSQAKEDTGTDKRTVQHYLTRTLNSLATQAEIADAQAAASLLGLKANVCTHSFAYFNPNDAIKYIQLKSTRINKPLAPTNVYSSRAPLYSVPSPIARTLLLDDSVEIGAHSSTVGDAEYGATLKLPISYAKHYYFRGKEFCNYSRIEYSTLVDIKRAKDVDIERAANAESNHDTSSNYHGGGRNKSTPYSFDNLYEIYTTYFQQLRSKQPIPILTGQLPRHPSMPPTDNSLVDERNQWQSEADKFAMYYLVAFRPEPDACNGNITSLPYTWDAFCSWMESLEQSSFLIDKFRAAAVINYIYGLYSRNFHRDLIFAYRSRDCTLWTEAERLAADQFFAAQATMHPTSDDFDAAVNATFVDRTPISPQLIKFADNEQHFCAMQAEALDEIFQDFHEQPAGNNNTHHDETNDETNGQYNLLHSPILSVPITTIQHSFERISSYKERYDESSLLTSNSVTTTNTSPPFTPAAAAAAAAATEENAETFLRKQHLSRDQNEYLKHILDHLKTHTRAIELQMTPPQILSLLTGDPGTGKSYTIDIIPSISDILLAGHVATASYNGMPAVLIHGSTLCSLLQIDFTARNHYSVYQGYVSPLSLEQCYDILNALGGNSMCIFIIDEASCLDPTTLAIVHIRLQQVFNCTTKPFGGKSLILVGDFNQLPNPDDFLPECLLTMASYDENASARHDPPHPSPLTKASKKDKFLSQKYSATSLIRQGCNLFTQFDRCHLTQQHRCQFPNHMKFITDLSNGNTITIDTIREQYKPFTSQTIHDDRQKWQFAPILVASNRERINISYRQCLAFAKAHNTHVYRWRTKFSKWRNAPFAAADRDNARQRDAVFWQYFVCLAEAFLTGNINPLINLANGTFVLLHSLTFATPADEYFAKQQAQLLPPGSIITLENPPASVNVIIVQPTSQELNNMSARSKAIFNHQMQILRALSLFPSDPSQPIVVPITTASKTNGKTYTIQGKTNSYAASRVFIKQMFNYEFAFAMTIHKAQGRTLRRVILALSCHPNHIQRMTFASIYVAFSRVKNPDDIRLLFHSPGGYPNYNELAYITELKPSKYTKAYYGGFINNRGIWNKAKSLEILCSLSSL